MSQVLAGHASGCLHFKTAADAKPASKETDDLKTDDPRECYARDIVKKSDLPEFKCLKKL